MVFTNKDKIIKYLIIFLPITLVLSIFFTELFLLIITIFFIKEYIKEKKNYKNFFFIFLFLFVLYISLSSITFDQGLNFKSYFLINNLSLCKFKVELIGIDFTFVFLI